MRRRLFVAGELDDDARAACARTADRLRAKGWPGRWIEPQNYHLTVAFIGNVDDERLDAIAGAVRDAAAQIHPIDVPLELVGAFPNARRPRVVWIGPREPVPAFGTLCGVVRSMLVAIGCNFDPHGDAHITLARSDGSAPLPRIEASRIAPVRIDALTLFESVTEPTGARYEAIERFPARS